MSCSSDAASRWAGHNAVSDRAQVRLEHAQHAQSVCSCANSHLTSALGGYEAGRAAAGGAVNRQPGTRTWRWGGGEAGLVGHAGRPLGASRRGMGWAARRGRAQERVADPTLGGGASAETDSVFRAIGAPALGCGGDAYPSQGLALYLQRART